MLDAVDRYEVIVSSALLEIEALQAARRFGAGREHIAAEALRAVAMLPIDAAIVSAAGRLDAPGLRSLNAIHLATAVSLGDELEALISYDRRQLRAAHQLGVPIPPDDR